MQWKSRQSEISKFSGKQGMVTACSTVQKCSQVRHGDQPWYHMLQGLWFALEMQGFLHSGWSFFWERTIVLHCYARLQNLWPLHSKLVAAGFDRSWQDLHVHTCHISSPYASFGKIQFCQMCETHPFAYLIWIPCTKRPLAGAADPEQKRRLMEVNDVVKWATKTTLLLSIILVG